MQYLDHDGTRLAFEITGRGSPLVLLHGLGSRHSQVRDALPLQDRMLITPDMPGHGATCGTCRGFRPFAALVLAMLDHLGIERVDLGGISMGSGISLAVALAAPDRVRRLLLIRPAWLDRPALPQLRLVAGIGDRIEREGVEAAGSWLADDAEMKSLAARIPRAAAAVRALLVRPQARESASVLPFMVADQPFPRLDDLRVIRCPALVIGNDQDPLHPAELAVTLAAAIPAATYRHAPSRYVEPAAHAAAIRQAALDFLQ